MDSLTPKKEVLMIGPNADERIAQQQQQPQEEGATRKPRLRERISQAGARERALMSEISVRAPRG
jgi:hypothetical protein